MAHIKSINITTPCLQIWQQMVPVEQGRYCQSCCKTVTDFSAMTDKEIINYLGGQENVCGRFADGQLGRLNERLQNNKPSFTLFKRIGFAAVVLMAIPFAKANAQKKHKTEQAPPVHKQRDTLNITPKQLTAAEIKVATATIKDADLQMANVSQILSGTIGGVTVTGINAQSPVVRIWTSIYDMLRQF